MKLACFSLSCKSALNITSEEKLIKSRQAVSLAYKCYLVGRLLKKTLNFMAPFYGWGSTASRLEPLRGGSLLFTTKFPEVPGTHSIDLGRMKG